MEKISPASIGPCVAVFKLAADATRLMVLALIEDGEKNVTELCSSLDSAQPAVSHHLALLRVADIVDSRREGKCNYYSLKPKGVAILAAVRAMSL